MTDREWEASSRPRDTEVAAAPQALLAAAGAVAWNGNGTGGPIERGDDIDPRDAEAIKLLTEHFGAHDPVALRNGDIGIWRPGKSTGRPSAVIGRVDDGVTTVWSTHWPPFELGKTYGLGALRSMAGLGPRFEIPAAGPELPAGYRLWREGDDIVPAPTLGPGAYHGVIGEYLHLVEGRTEGHPAAIGAHLIPCFGTMLSRKVSYAIDGQHPASYWAVVGPTSSGAKGSALKAALTLVQAVYPGFLKQHSISGVGSGETLVYEMRDDADEPVETEEPVETSRIILNAELSRVLRVVRREGSILGDILREAYDGLPIRHSSDRGRNAATSSAHNLSIIGSITPSELRSLTEEQSVLNGFSNRFVHCWSEGTCTLPFGGNIPAGQVNVLAQKVNNALAKVGRRPAINGTRPYFFADGEPPLWKEFFEERRWGIGDTEIMKAITGRQVSHAARTALIYSALDGSEALGDAHIRAGIAWADYSVATIEKVFTDGATGKAGQLLTGIRDAGADGLDGVGQDAMFQKNLNAGALPALRSELEIRRLIVTQTTLTGGRPRLVSYAITPIDGRR